jgi:two-component system, LytTR family, sensor kinase
MGWIAYAFAWLAATFFWALAAGVGAAVSPLEAIPMALANNAVAGIFGVAIWWMSGRVAFDSRSPSFYATHLAGIIVYAVLYATSWMWIDLVRGRLLQALTELRGSPYLFWNLLMGSWLYLVVAGISYAIRAQQRLRAQEASAAEARSLAQQAQLAALRAQINPHFLFNALHSVGALVTIDPRRADQALESLGDLLRYALGTGDAVLFAQEWRFTQDYLAFEHLRLGDRLHVDAEVDPAAMSFLVPPLLLQPLVENAVRHGIADRPEGGRIGLRATVDDSRLIVRVTDDGRGDATQTRDGLGLASVRRRLAALYGDSATLATDRLPTGFHVTIELPGSSA